MGKRKLFLPIRILLQILYHHLLGGDQRFSHERHERFQIAFVRLSQRIEVNAPVLVFNHCGWESSLNQNQIHENPRAPAIAIVKRVDADEVVMGEGAGDNRMSCLQILVGPLDQFLHFRRNMDGIDVFVKSAVRELNVVWQLLVLAGCGRFLHRLVELLHRRCVVNTGKKQSVNLLDQTLADRSFVPDHFVKKLDGFVMIPRLQKIFQRFSFFSFMF